MPVVARYDWGHRLPGLSSRLSCLFLLRDDLRDVVVRVQRRRVAVAPRDRERVVALTDTPYASQHTKTSELSHSRVVVSQLTTLPHLALHCSRVNVVCDRRRVQNLSQRTVDTVVSRPTTG